jgi:hypothetical protein
MGNCIKFYNQNQKIKNTNNNLSVNQVKKIFIEYNILDSEKNIIIGIWDNPNKFNNLGNQGIWIENHKKIYQLVFGIICNNTVILTFEDNLILKITKNILLDYDYLLEISDKKLINYSTKINKNILNKLKNINNNSPDLDLIINLINKKK